MGDVRRSALVAFAFVVLAACDAGSDGVPIEASTTITATTSAAEAPTSTTTTTTTTTMPTTTTLSEEEKAEIQLDQDARLIRQVWREFSDVTGESSQATYEFLAVATHPIYGCSADDFRAFYNWPEDYVFEVIVDLDTFEPDPSWSPPRFPGEVPEGLYIYQAIFTTSSSSQGWAPEQTLLEVHGAVVGDTPYVFFECH